ncbi:MAG: deoxyribodipyrimidine photo-lyase, partial [Bacteroidetes bacterium]|nr:deoxyribodipyrimidine photo-lyase [Bacteroidota bacterium]
MSQPLHICWFRRDLRLHDNAALYYALKAGGPVLPLFIFDRNILDDLGQKADRRVEFIHQAIEDMQATLHSKDSGMEVHYGHPIEVFKTLLGKYKIAAVHSNQDYDPYAIERDTAVARLLKEQDIPFYGYKDQVLLDKSEVLKDDGKPYTVFTPYSRRWHSLINDFYLKSY